MYGSNVCLAALSLFTMVYSRALGDSLVGILSKYPELYLEVCILDLDILLISIPLE